MTRPRRSTRITRLHSYHGAVRPCATHRYSTPHGFDRLGISRPQPAAGSIATGRPRARSDRFPRSTPEPRPSSRRLHAGHHPARQQAPARLIPKLWLGPGFDVIFPVSTRHQRFTHVRLLGRYLTRSTARRLRNAQHPGSYPTHLAVVCSHPLQDDCGGPPTQQQASPSISDAAPHPETRSSTSQLL